MSGFEDLKDVFRRRLLAADIRDEAGKTTKSGYEEELHRQRKLLHVILTPEIKLSRADVQPLLKVKEELSHEQQVRSPSQGREDTESPQIKEELEEFCINQEGQQLQGFHDTTKVPFTPVSAKSEDDKEESQSSDLHQTQFEQMGPGADGNDFGGAEARDPEGHLQPEIEVEIEDSSEPETDNSEDYMQGTREHQSTLNFVENFKDGTPKKDKKPHSCSVCGKKLKTKRNLRRHMSVHTGEKPFSCSECGKRFKHKGNLAEHIFGHTGEKPFSCPECGKTFRNKQSLTRHLSVHTGERSFSCSECGKKFNNRQSLTRHMFVHTGEKPFSCSECGKRFNLKGNLNLHMKIHTGEKPFSCSECGKGFKRKGNLTEHMSVHKGEKPFRCS